MALVKATSVLRISRPICAMSSRMYSDDYGKAGAIREAGGAFGKREAAQEEQYFRKLQGEQLKRLKAHLDEEITFHQAQMKIHKEAAERHEKRVKELQEKKESHDD